MMTGGRGEVRMRELKRVDWKIQRKGKVRSWRAGNGKEKVRKIGNLHLCSPKCHIMLKLNKAFSFLSLFIWR